MGAYVRARGDAYPLTRLEERVVDDVVHLAVVTLHLAVGELLDGAHVEARR